MEYAIGRLFFFLERKEEIYIALRENYIVSVFPRILLV